MSLQDIRHYYEQPIVDWCAANGVELRAANMVEPNSDAAGEFVVTNLNFGNFTEQTLCGAIENVRGSLVVDFYSPKGVGPARAQTVMLAIMSELLALTTRPACPDLNGSAGTTGANQWAAIYSVRRPSVFLCDDEHAHSGERKLTEVGSAYPLGAPA